MSGRVNRATGAAATAVSLAIAIGGCAGRDAIAQPVTKNVTLGFVNGGNTEFHTCLQRSVEAEAARRGVKVISTNRAKAKAVAAKMIKDQPGMTYAFVANEDMAIGVAQAFQAAHKTVKIATVNGTDAGLAAIRSGQFRATVANPASKLGQKAVDNTISLLNKEPITKIDYAPIDLITKTELTQAPAYCLTE